jgi:mono/diheme cytochrome c family protein
MLKPFLMLCAAVLVVISPALAPTAAAGSMPLQAAPGSTNPVKPTADSQAKAKKLYTIDCAVCHGDNGNGKTDLATDMQLTLPDFSDPKSLADKSDKELFDIIRNGKDKMPPEDASRAKDTDVWSLVTYIRGMSKGQPGN